MCLVAAVPGAACTWRVSVHIGLFLCSLNLIPLLIQTCNYFSVTKKPLITSSSLRGSTKQWVEETLTVLGTPRFVHVGDFLQVKLPSLHSCLFYCLLSECLQQVWFLISTRINYGGNNNNYSNNNKTLAQFFKDDSFYFWCNTFTWIKLCQSFSCFGIWSVCVCVCVCVCCGGGSSTEY